MPRRSPRPYAVALVPLLAVALLASACGDGDDPVSPLQPQGADLDVSSSTPEPPSSPEPADQLAGFTPRSVTYLHGDITVTGVEVSEESPGTYGEAAAEYGDVSYLYLAVTVENLLNHTPLLINDGIFLDPGDGDLIKYTGRTDASGVIAAGTTATGWYGFALPDGAALTDPTLVLGEPGHRQERLPLSGRVSEPEYPKPIEMPSPGTVLVRDGCPLEVEVTEAYLAHSVSFDRGSRSYTTEQAGADRLMLYLGLAVTAPPGSRSCFIATTSDVHLVVDGVRLGDIPELSDTDNISEGTTRQEYLVYDIPATGRVQIEWGALGGDQQRTDVPVR